MLNDQLLSAYIDTFYGYGTYAAPYWFVGMEEGGGGSLSAADGRITQWLNRGQNELEPLRDDDSISTSPWFRPNPKAQPTWKHLIRMALVAQGLSPSLEEIKAYQRDRLGRAHGETCLLELLPLPSPSTRDWYYSPYTSLPQLQSREIYMNHYAPSRAEHLREQVSTHIPKPVVFYSVNHWYRRWWELIAGVPFKPETTSGGDILLGVTSATTFAIVKHPVSMGVTKRYYEDIGKLLVKAGS
jgi:hypothetical protein